MNPKDVRDIYHLVVKPLRPDTPDGKLNKKELEIFSRRLTDFIIGMIVGADLSGDKIDRLAEQIKKLNQK